MKNKQTVILICLCIAYALLRWAYMDYPAIDDTKRLSAAISISTDQGYVLPSYDLATDQLESVKAATLWPPLTSHIYAFLTRITSHYYASYVITEFLFGWILILSLWYLMAGFKPQLRLGILILLIFNPIFIQKCISIDLYSASITLLGVAIFRRSQELERLSIWFVISLVCISLGCFFRFNFYPMAFAPLAALVIIHWKKIMPITRGQWILSVAVPSVLIGIHLLWIKSLGATDTYISDLQSGIYLSNLLNIKAYNTTLILGLDTGYFKSMATSSSLDFVWQWINVLLSTVEIALTVWLLGSVYRNPRGSVDVLLSVLIVFTVLPLFLLSLRTYVFADWTFWTETRYFSLAALATLLLVGRYFSFSGKRSYFTYALLVLLGIWAIGIHSYRLKTNKYQWHNPATELYAHVEISSTSEKESDLIFSNNHSHVSLLAQQGKKAYYYDVAQSLRSCLYELKDTKSKRILVTHYTDEYSKSIENLISEEKLTFDVHIEQR